MAKYSVRFVHKISPSDTDRADDIELSGGAFSDRKTLAKALREAGVLISGGRLKSFRVEGDKVVCFPSVPGLTTYWHSIILTSLEEETDLQVSGGGSVYLLTPVSEAGKQWVSDNIPQDAITLGNGIAVEHRFIGDIVQGARADGLVVK